MDNVKLKMLQMVGATEADTKAPEKTDKERIAELENENADLLECVLEMSEIVYA